MGELVEGEVEEVGGKNKRKEEEEEEERDGVEGREETCGSGD